jgi:hypothetical protein
MLQARPIAISAAVLCFFALSIVGAVGGHDPYVCCERAVLGAALTYAVASLVVATINTILTQALAASQMSQEEERPSAAKN